MSTIVNGCEYDATVVSPRVLAGALLLAVALLVSPGIAAAADAAGRVVSAVGTVHAIGADGDSRTLERGDSVHAGDTLRLGERASAQLRMRDDALIDLEAGTRFVIERYESGDDGGSAVMSFLAGALRTVTGAISKAGEDEYRMQTPVATIGVRGTQYALELCEQRCARRGEPTGLYGRVDEGAIGVSNDAASVEFTRNQYFVVTARDEAPREIVRPPESVLAGGAIGRGERLVSSDDEILAEEDLLSSTSDTLLDTTGTLLDTGGTLIEGTLATSGELLEGTGELLGDAGGLLDGDGGGLLDGGGGGLLGGDDGSLLEDSVDTIDNTVDDTVDSTEDTLDTLEEDLL